MLLRFKQDNATDKDEEETSVDITIDDNNTLTSKYSHTISWYTIIFKTARYIYNIPVQLQLCFAMYDKNANIFTSLQ